MCKYAIIHIARSQLKQAKESAETFKFAETPIIENIERYSKVFEVISKYLTMFKGIKRYLR